MSYSCSKCAYTTNSRRNYEKHMARKISCVPEERCNAHICSKCNDAFSTVGFLDSHSKKCTGVSPNQCPGCHRVFCDRSARDKHVKRRACPVVGTIPQTSITETGQGLTAGDHATITNSNNKTINNVTINCTPAQKDEIASFLDTDLDAVVQLILKDPSRFQLALQNGNIHQELCKATHFGEIAHNKNILGIQEKGTSMRVIQDGQKMSMCKSEGITRIINNNHKIATDDKTAEYFGKEPIRKNDRVRQAISRVVQNKGGYVPKNDFTKFMPEGSLPDKVHEDMVNDFHTAVIAYWNLSEYAQIVPFGVKCFQHVLMFDRGRWWRSVNDGSGWAICDNPRDTVSECIVEFLDLVKKGLEEVKANSESTKDDIWHCKDVQEALDYLRPAEFANLVYTQATTGTF